MAAYIWISQAPASFFCTRAIQYAFLGPHLNAITANAIAGRTHATTRHAGRFATTGLFSQMERALPMNQPAMSVSQRVYLCFRIIHVHVCSLAKVNVIEFGDTKVVKTQVLFFYILFDFKSEIYRSHTHTHMHAIGHIYLWESSFCSESSSCCRLLSVFIWLDDISRAIWKALVYFYQLCCQIRWWL